MKAPEIARPETCLSNIDAHGTRRRLRGAPMSEDAVTAAAKPAAPDATHPATPLLATPLLATTTSATWIATKTRETPLALVAPTNSRAHKQHEVCRIGGGATERAGAWRIAQLGGVGS